MDNNSSFSLAAFIINIISLVTNIIGFVITILILTCILLRRKTLYDTQLVLCCNNYILLLALSIVTFTLNIRVLRGDLELSNNEKETLVCRAQSYIVYSLISAVYIAFALQGAFRFCCIVYRSHRKLVQPRIYWIVIPILWIFSFVLNSPLFIWHGQQLITSEHACLVSKDDPLSIAYSILTVYGVPFISVALIYFKVTLFLHRQVIPNSIRNTIRAQHRDILVLRRIVFIVVLLGSYGMPISIMLIILAFTGELMPCFYRILVLSISICSLTLSIALIYITSELKNKIKFCRKRTTVVPIAITTTVHKQLPTERMHQSSFNQTLRQQ